MKALTLRAADGPRSAELLDHPKPEPAPGEVRVAVKAAALNHRELWISRGQYPRLQLPCTLGADGAGRIEAVGEGVSASMIGQDVVLYPGLGWGDNPRFPSKRFGLLGMPGPGTIAEFICVPAENALTKPASLSFEEAAALPTAALTAWRGLTRKAELKVGERILITGVGGGVAGIALSLALAMGAEAYVTSGHDETIEHAVRLGAKAGFNHRSADWGKQLASTGEGLDVVFDGAPAASYQHYMRAVKLGGRIVFYGSTGGPAVTVNAPELFLKHATIHGTAMGDLADFAAMLDFFAVTGIKPHIEKRFTLDQSHEAIAFLEDSHRFGKVVISI